jgi:hypothetical protein
MCKPPRHLSLDEGFAQKNKVLSLILVRPRLILRRLVNKISVQSPLDGRGRRPKGG